MKESVLECRIGALACADIEASARSRTDAFVSRRLRRPSIPGIKVNLYRDYEYRAVAQSATEIGLSSIETVMVGDSYFMTHLGRSSTNLDKADSRLAFELLPKLVSEIKREIEKDEFGIERPLLMADIPGGLNEAQTAAIIAKFSDAGADIVKAEVTAESDLWRIELIAERGLLSALHLGYAPQSGENRTYGVSVQEVRSYLSLLERGARAGACYLILERLTEVANAVLTRHALSLGVLPYSIFSGRAPLGGQCLNVWDAVVKSERESIFFPPTAYLTRAQVECEYRAETILPCVRRLLKLTNAGVFPPSPHNRLDVDTCLEILAGEVRHADC